ncbi:MAG TPA: hypothetical protein VEA16_11820, partial [Vicinamibacterales bacterium]|nr:hypothetical protein [Vicinamibacterales bacterium]
PRQDQNAIRERLRAVVPTVDRAAWATYDQLLRSQGVEEGVQSYSRVIELLLGTDVLKVPPMIPQAASPQAGDPHAASPAAQAPPTPQAP